METEDQEFSNASDEDFTNLDSSTDSDAVSEHSSDNESENSTQADSKTKKKKQKKSPAKKSKKATKHKIIFNVSDTQYDVVKYVGKKIFKWKLSYDKESPDWDVFWTDNAVQPETLARMQTYQKINHFPGMYSLARKNHLGRNLMRMKRAFPEQFKFFPQTFLLPSEYGEFRLQFNKKKAKTFIVKPEASCQGRGIFLTRTSESVQPGEHYVAQRYIHKPYLIDGLKFDMRIYVLLAGCDPLKIFLYDDGLGRFATEEYVAPTGDNLDNVCMHLTNYAINKDNPNFVFNESSSADDVGHKRSLKAVMRTLKEQGHDVDALWKEIRKIIIKTFCSVQPILAHSYKSCHPDEPYNNMCFELLGFDVMLDHKLKPWLIEVNHTPSFTTDTPLDKQIKKSAIRDALKLMNISIENTNKMKNKKRAELQQRVLTGKKVKTTPEERQAAFEKAQLERNSWEAKNHGRYTKIFPFDDPAEAEEDYEEFMRVANKWWEEWTGTSIKRNVKKQTQQEPNKPPPMVFGQGPSNMSTRAKEIQSIYSQKLKTGPYSSKPGSVQNQRMSQASSTAYNSPHNKQAAVNPNKTMKTREWEENSANMNMQGGTKELDDDNKNYMNHLAAIAEVEGNMDTIPEDQEEDWYGKGQDLTKQRRTIQTQQAPGYKRDTLAKETSSGLPQATEAALNSALEGKVNGARSTSFRITNKLSQQTKESPQKPAGERGVSEDPKFHFSRKFAHYLMSDKIEDGNPTHESKAVLERETETRAERERESYNSRKTPLKMSNGILGTFGMVTESLWHGANGTGAMMSIDADREPRNVSVGGLMRIDAKNEYNMKSASKKTTVVVPTQYKQTKNYVAPRLYEMTGGASKEGGPVKATSNNGLGLSLQGLGVGNKVAVPANPRESNSGLNYFQDSQASVQKYYNFLTRGKK